MTLKQSSRESHLGRQHKKQGELLMHSIAFLSSENKASICFVLDCIIPWQILWSIVILHCCNIETLHPLTCAPELIALKFPIELLQWKINRASKTSSGIWIVRIMSCVHHDSCSIPAKLLHTGVFLYRRGHAVSYFIPYQLNLCTKIGWNVVFNELPSDIIATM